MAKHQTYLDEFEGRIIFFDTETTGFNATGIDNRDKIVEIGCVEVEDGKRQDTYHVYINPEREIPDDAIAIHGITDDQVQDERKFYQVAEEFLSFVNGATVVAHNAEFDVSFINAELEEAGRRLNKPLGKIEDYCTVVDSLKEARRLMPGRKNDLDSLAKRFKVDTSSRDLHGALVDSVILADVYGAIIKYERENDIKVVEKPYQDVVEVKEIKLNKRPRKSTSLSL